MQATSSTAQTWMSRSPWVRLASITSPRKCGIGRSLAGFRSPRPYRSSNSEAPTATVIVRLLGPIEGPSTPLSGGG